MNKNLFILFWLISLNITAQKVSFDNMNYWVASGKTNWSVVAAVKSDYTLDENISTEPGTGILVNQPEKGNNANLQSIASHGDADISFDFMMAKHSNSGFYLQGRYEIQLLDSWGVVNPHTGDCGGIYKRRKFIKDANGKVHEYLFDGHAPRVNTCLAPGLWQHMDIQFQAPKFDASGNKIANAKVLMVKMNGVVIQENVELSGPTGGPISETEVPLGPIMIQGDHGKVAFRNMSVQNLTGKPVEIKSIDYASHYGSFRKSSDFLTRKPDKVGKLEKFTWEASSQPNDFAVVYKSILNVPEAGKQSFTFQLAGIYSVKIGDKMILPEAWTVTRDQRKASADLPAGNVPMEIVVYKIDGWLQPVMAAWVAGPSFRAVPLHTLSSVLSGSPRDPILLNATVPTILRSFSDIYKNGEKLKRITHGVNVGDPAKLHYTYDLDNGTIAQIWKGDFLDTSPMWDDRGDGSSRPRGVVLPFNILGQGKFSQVLPMANSGSLPVNFKTLGYDLDENDRPTFKYSIYDSEISDKIRIVDNKFLERKINVKNSKNNLSFIYQITEGKTITKQSENTYLVDNTYIIKVEGASIDTINGTQILSKPIGNELVYSIIW